MRILLLILGFTFFTQAKAQQKILKSIKLTNQVNKTPLANATLYSDDFRYWLQSNDAGILAIDSLPDSWTHFNLSHVGYKTIRLSKDSLLQLQRIEMVPTLSSLSEVVVNAAGRQGIFKTISDLDIHLRPIVNSQEVLRIVPGLFIGQHAGGGKAEQIFLRGFDIDHGTDIQITVDGMPVNMV
nr:Plug domain-containing protein [Chitinophagaceae bacterium]